jgi:hypothetical protein
VEGRGRELEGEARDHQHEAKDGDGREVARKRVGHVREHRRAGDAVDQDEAVEEHGGGDDARYEVLHPALCALAAAPVESDHGVGRNGCELYREEDAEKVPHGDEERRPEHDREDEHQVFGGVAGSSGPAGRGEHGDEGRAGDDQLEVEGEAVDHVAAAEVGSREACREQDGGAGEHGQGSQGGEACRYARVPLGERADEEDQDHEGGRDQLGQERDDGLSRDH